MIEILKNILLTLHAVNLFPEIAVAAAFAYFLARQRYTGLEASRAIYVPLLVSFIGEFAFAWPVRFQDIFMNATMAFVQAGVAVGMYSMADKYGWMDKLGERVAKKIEDRDDAKPAA